MGRSNTKRRSKECVIVGSRMVATASIAVVNSERDCYLSLAHSNSHNNIFMTAVQIL